CCHGFHALAVHLWWCPDPIAAAVLTKTTLQVKQDGAMRLQRIEDGCESPSDLIDINTDQDDSNLGLDVEPTYQVSKVWVALEEALAAYVIEEENTALLEHHRGTASDWKKAKEKCCLRINDGRKGCRPRYRRHASPVHEETQQQDETPPEQPHAKRPRVIVACDHYMSHLDDAHLTELNFLIKAAEESLTIVRIPPETGVLTHAQGLDTDDPSDALIDPALLAISQVLSRTTPIPTATISDPPAGTSTNNGLSHFSYSSPSAPNEDPPSLNPDLLSPRSWLHLQKHLYMRRHQAKLWGQLDSAHNLTLTFPGLLTTVHNAKEVETTPAPSMSCLPDIEADDQQPTKPKHSKSGLTFLYKIRAIFRELGIDAAYLRAQGMDLIHLCGWRA
ncbi:hypothetical protein SCLCIDRAFT_1224817, partial [Scleroderma citrinum Foug A]